MNAAIGTGTTPRTISDSDLNFGVLQYITDLFYGGVLAYGVYLIAKAILPLIEVVHSRNTPFSWNQFLLLLFVVNFLYSDYFEARLINGVLPYNSRKRPVVDSLIPILFVISFVAANSESSVLALSLAAICYLGAVWAAFLALDLKGAKPRYFKVHYASVIFVAHLFLGGMWTVVYFEEYLKHHRLIEHITMRWDLTHYWGVYIASTILLLIIRKLGKLPRVEADLLPMWTGAMVVGNLARLPKLCKSLVDIFTEDC